MANTRRAQRGGKKGTRKLGKKMSSWNKLVMQVYRELKAKKKDTKLGDAMKEAKKRKGSM